MQIYKFASKNTIKTQFLAFNTEKRYVTTAYHHHRSDYRRWIFCTLDVINLPLQGASHGLGDIDKQKYAEVGYQMCRTADSRRGWHIKLPRRRLLGQLRRLRYRAGANSRQYQPTKQREKLGAQALFKSNNMAQKVYVRGGVSVRE